MSIYCWRFESLYKLSSSENRQKTKSKRRHTLHFWKFSELEYTIFMIRLQIFIFILRKFLQMSKLPCNILKFSGGCKCPPPGLQYIIGFAKPLSLELQKSRCDLVQAQAEANHTKIVTSKRRTETVYSGSYKRAVGIVETVNVTPANPRSNFFSRQKHSANVEADTEEAYFRRNMFYHWRNGATLPKCSNPILQVSYF